MYSTALAMSQPHGMSSSPGALSVERLRYWHWNSRISLVAAGDSLLMDTRRFPRRAEAIRIANGQRVIIRPWDRI